MYHQLNKQLLFLIMILGCSSAYGAAASFVFSFNDNFVNPHLSMSVNQSMCGTQIYYDKNMWLIRPYLAQNAAYHNEKATIAQQALGTFLVHATFSGSLHVFNRYQAAQPDELPILQAQIRQLERQNKEIAQNIKEHIGSNIDKEFVSQWKDLIAVTPQEDRASLIPNLEKDINKFPTCSSQLEQLKQSITS